LLRTSTITSGFEPAGILNTSINYSLVFDESGIMFLGQEDKISIFKRFSWSNVHVNGEILLTRNSNNTIFFSGDKKFGFLKADSAQKFRLVYLDSLIPQKAKPFKKAGILKCIENTVYFKSDSFLISYHSNEFRVLQTDFEQGKIFV